MPIKTYLTDPHSPIETFLEQANQPHRLNPLTPEQPADTAPSWREALTLNTSLNSITGAALTDSLPYLINRHDTPDDTDPAWDVKKYTTPDFLNSHPFLVEDFMDGTVDDFPNEQRFLNWVSRKRQDAEAREQLGQASLGKQIITALPGQIIDGAIGGAALKMFGLAGKAATVGNWARAGGFGVRVAKSAGVAAGLNLAQEESLRILSPDRNVEEDEAAYWAMGMGAAFGTAVPVMVRGLTKSGEMVGTARIRRLQGDVAQTLASPRVENVTAQAAADAATLRSSLSTMVDTTTADIDGPPTHAMGASEPMFRGDADAAGSDQSRHYTVLDTPETRPLMDELRAKHGEDVVFHRHPMQDDYDWAQRLTEMEATLAKSQPEDLGRVTGLVIGVLERGLPVSGLEAPGPRAMRSPSLWARDAARLYMDMPHATQESADNPITHRNDPSAESLRWNLDATRDQAHLAMEDALREGLKSGPIVYVASDGTVMTIKNRMLGRRDFNRAVTDYLRMADESARGRGRAENAPDSIRRAAEAFRKYYQRLGLEAKDAGFLRDLDPHTIWQPRRWLSDQVRRRSTEFKRRLVQAFHLNRKREFVGGRAINPDTRTIVDGVVNHTREGQADGRGLTAADRTAILSIAPDGGLDKLTEIAMRARLGEDLYRRYLEEVDVYFEAAAESTFKTLTGLENRHGVEHGMGNVRPFRERLLQIDETTFADFLEGDANRLMESYHATVAGRVAVRQAIRRAEATWAPRVLEATGQHLADSGFDPSLVNLAVRHEFQKWMDATQGNRAAQVKIEQAMKATVGDRGSILDATLATLEGRPVFPDNPAATAGWRLVLERTALRLPFVTMLGKVTVSAFTDLAAATMYSRATPRRLSTMVQTLNVLKRMSPRQLQGLYVATSDMARGMRAMELGEVGPYVDHSTFGPGLKGKVLAGIDGVGEYVSRKFATATGLNRWNHNLKVGMAHVIGDTIIEGAGKMALAMDIMEATGATQADAIAKVGLSPEDAARLNRLGFNGERCRRLMDLLYEHGVDHEGNRPWAGDSAAFDKFEGFIFPELSAWHSIDREMFDVWTSAVNGEVQNVIIEPKLGSRPIVNNSFGGKVFNQFQAFASAFGTQQAPMMGARPGYEIAAYATLMVGLGGLVDAIHNSLSGRRSLEDSAKLWKDKPAGMFYGAVNRSGVLGWLARPLGLLEQTPIGIGKALGNDTISTMNARPGPMVEQLGPFFTWANKTYTGVTNSIADGRMSERSRRQLWQAVPFRNWWALELYNRAMEQAGYDEATIGPKPLN